MNHNGKKSNTISALKRKNMELARQLKELNEHDYSTVQWEHILRLEKSVRRCACPSMYSTSQVSGKTSYIGSIRCDNKFCFVCNFARQKLIRRKYIAWFNDNKEICILKKANGKQFFSTLEQHKNKYKDCSLISKTEYDLMHLTLTVPHSPDNGFSGEKYYYEKLASMFHTLRNKNKYFIKEVIGGEYGIETTQPNNLHIHIHALLLVKKGTKNRNLLHYETLRAWNKLSVNTLSTRTKIESFQYDAIKAGNELITDSYIKALHPKGATIIGLETIYTLNPQGEKVRSKEWADEAMMKGVLETISYHFHPTAFDKESKEFDITLLSELMPIIYGKQLYRKFGVLHGEKSLNIKTETTGEGEEFDQMLRVIDNSVVDENTGEIIEDLRTFFITSPAFVYHDPNNDFKIHLSQDGTKKRTFLSAITTKQAIHELRELIKESYQTKARNRAQLL